MSPFGSLAERLRRRTAVTQAATQPLLDATELATLAALARHWPLSGRSVDVHEHHAGDWSSTSTGRGLDFEESRPYAPGDSSFFPCYTIKTGPEECGDFPTQLALAVHEGRERPSEALLDEHPLGLPGVRVVGECVVDERR